MSKFTGPHDAPNQGKIPKIAHLFWTKARAYHGEDVTLSVRTENVPDGAAAVLTIFAAGGGDAIDTIKNLTIQGSQLDHTYTIAWKGKPLPKRGHAFVFKAAIGKLTSPESGALFVDVEPPVFSA